MGRRSKRTRTMFTPLVQQWEQELRDHLIQSTSGTPPPEAQERAWRLARRLARLHQMPPEHLIIGFMKNMGK